MEINSPARLAPCRKERRPEIEEASVVRWIPVLAASQSASCTDLFPYRRVRSFALTDSAGMLLLTTGLEVAAFPTEVPCQQADKVGQSDGVVMLPDRWNRRVKLHLNVRTRDFARHFEARNFKNDITVWFFFVFSFKIKCSELNKSPEIYKNNL